MDLNLYLNLVHSPTHRGSDLGSDLALGSIPLVSEEIGSASETTVLMEPLQSHTPYSPTNASFGSTQNSVDLLEGSEIPIPPIECPPFRSTASFRPVSLFSREELRSSSRLEDFPFNSRYFSALSSSEETNVELSHPDANDAYGHVPYSPSYSPISTTGEDGTETAFEDLNGDTEYVRISPSYIPVPVPASQQSDDALVLENFDRYFSSTPSYLPFTPILQDGDLGREEDDNRNTAYVLNSSTYSPGAVPEHLNDILMPEDIDPYVPTSPLIDAFMSTLQSHVERTRDESLQLVEEYSQAQVSNHIGEPLSVEGPSRQDFLPPEARFRRLIESNGRRRFGRFRSAATFHADPGYVASALNVEDHILQQVVTQPSSLELPRSDKIQAEAVVARDKDEETKEQGHGAANFECNICLDMAQEPVVTSCGHLFCWPCLYQWLHMHCNHKECPVCKGEVIESQVTPIYGRGSSESSAENRSSEGGNLGSGLVVPPRPRGHRVESLRQQIQRPYSRRLHEPSSWRRIVDEDLRNTNRVEEQGRRVLASLRAYQRLRREGNSENRLSMWSSGLSPNANGTLANSQAGTRHNDGHHVGSSSPLFPEGIDFWHRVALNGLPNTERIVAMTDELNVMRGMTTAATHSNSSGSVNLQNTLPVSSQGTRRATSGAEQASASSTMATIEGDVGVTNSSGEANAAGSSRSLRRRRRNGASSSVDVDGGLHVHKRRRMN